MLAFLRHREEAIEKLTHGEGDKDRLEHIVPQIIVDVHPSRPIARGIAPLSVGRVIGRLPEDPSFESIAVTGGIIETHAEGHTIAGSTVYVSGEIPRVTPFEAGLLGGVRWIEDEGPGKWVKEEVTSFIYCSGKSISYTTTTNLAYYG